MLNRLTRPFKKRYNKYADKISGFVVPVKDAVDNLKGMVPGANSFAGSEESGDCPEQGGFGLDIVRSRLKNFKKTLHGLSDFQKLILLTIGVCLPAGIIMAVFLAKFFRERKVKR